MTTDRICQWLQLYCSYLLPPLKEHTHGATYFLHQPSIPWPFGALDAGGVRRVVRHRPHGFRRQSAIPRIPRDQSDGENTNPMLWRYDHYRSSSHHSVSGRYVSRKTIGTRSRNRRAWRVLPLVLLYGRPDGGRNNGKILETHAAARSKQIFGLR